MVRGRITWSDEEEAAIKDGVSKHGVGKWRTILNDPEFSTVLKLRTNVDLKDKWRNLNERKGECRDGYKPQKNLEKTITHYNKSAALTSDARDKDEITQAEGAVVIVHKSSVDGDSNKLMSRLDDGKRKRLTNAEQPPFSSAQNQEKSPPPNLKVYLRRNKKTVSTDGELNKEKLPPPNLKLFMRRNKRMITSGTLREPEIEYDATASVSMQDRVCAEPIRARQMSDEDSVAVAAAPKKAKTAVASGEQAEKEAVKMRKQKRRL